MTDPTPADALAPRPSLDGWERDRRRAELARVEAAIAAREAETAAYLVRLAAFERRYS